MNEKLDRWIDALRHELQQYGEMLALFDQQQQSIARREADRVLDSVALINSHTAQVEAARRSRVDRQQELAESLSVPPDGRVATLMPALPPARRSQAQALVDENNRLLQRVRQRARQNHLMLSHSLEHMNRFLQALTGAARGSLYNDGGTVTRAETPGPTLYEAVG
jgi:flagellar biosynthesis/type III secretory pathway chaperone